jgi:hypothetical protein
MIFQQRNPYGEIIYEIRPADTIPGFFIKTTTRQVWMSRNTLIQMGEWAIRAGSKETDVYGNIAGKWLERMK